MSKNRYPFFFHIRIKPTSGNQINTITLTEAFVVDDSIYLFTETVETKKRLFTRSQNAGKSGRSVKGILQYKGLITGTTMSFTKIIALSGYSKRLSPFIYLLYDYNSSFFSGNKKKLKLRCRFIKSRVSLPR
jgi:hypothetical protein